MEAEDISNRKWSGSRTSFSLSGTSQCTFFSIQAPSSPLCLEYFFRLELISLNAAGKTISKEYRLPFTEGDCWGYNDFVPL